MMSVIGFYQFSLSRHDPHSLCRLRQTEVLHGDLPCCCLALLVSPIFAPISPGAVKGCRLAEDHHRYI